MFARRVGVIGTGYVGLTTGACLASLDRPARRLPTTSVGRCSLNYLGRTACFGGRTN
jgi:hypothetical protein